MIELIVVRKNRIMENNTNSTILKRDLISSIEKSTNSVRVMLITFFFLCLIIKYIFDVVLPLELFIIEAVWLLLSFPFFYIITKTTKVEKINNIHFAWIICELLLLTIIIHFTGGVTWIVPFVYMFFPIYETFLFGKKQRTIMLLATISFFLSLAFLEYFKIISPHIIFPGINILYSKSYFVTIAIIVSGMIVFSFVATNLFHEELGKKLRQLSRVNSELKEIKDSLAIRVKAKTKELENINFELEEKVKKRTVELKERVEELERFQKITVGRELKMVELKKEIERLEKNLKKKS